LPGREFESNHGWRAGLNDIWLSLGDNPVDAKATPLTGTVVGDDNAKAHLFGFYASWRP
jgi:hypothetical protein